ncbi:DUF1801 domain-containing protein [Sphingomonas sp. GCM10030256]|uniref:DUF1801 domain-containing protein n=1 Tax=Sphingomonas sp. GCM10030256 TaxID=3273427 RepID=UPI0036116F34
MSSADAAIAEFIAGLEPERGALLAQVRAIVNQALPDGYRESFAPRMITWSIPLETYPDTYNKQPLALAALAAQKNHNALYLMGLYLSPQRSRAFEQAYAAAGKRLDMGKSCLRFKRREDLCEAAIRDAIAAVPVDTYIRDYEATRRR